MGAVESLINDDDAREQKKGSLIKDGRVREMYISPIYFPCNLLIVIHEQYRSVAANIPPIIESLHPPPLTMQVLSNPVNTDTERDHGNYPY